jgi:hypothetical protein
MNKIIHELENDPGVTHIDHDLAIRLIGALGFEKCMWAGKGRICYNGEWTPYSHNRLLQNGPKIVTRRLFNVSTVPSIPNVIILGTGTSAYDRTFPGCETAISDAGLVFAADSSPTIGTADANYGDDKCTINYDWGTLTLSGGPYTVSEMALRNTDGTPLNFNRLLIANKQISTGGTLQAECVVQCVP